MPPEDEANHAEHDPGLVADGELIGALGDAAELLQVPDRALDDVALAIAPSVEAPAAHGALVLTSRQHGRDAMAPAPAPHGGEAVGLVACERRGIAARRSAPAGDTDRVEQRGRGREVARLPGMDGDGEAEPLAVSDEGELGAEPAAAASQGMIERLAGR